MKPLRPSKLAIALAFAGLLAHIQPHPRPRHQRVILRTAFTVAAWRRETAPVAEAALWSCLAALAHLELSR